MSLKAIIARMFLDTYYHTIDGKGRLIIPSKYRAHLASGCVVMPGFQNGGLALIDLEAFEGLVAQLKEKLNPFDPRSQNFRRRFMASASNLEVDGAGRINIPARLRELAALDGDVVVAGVGTYIEIWNRARWESTFTAHDSTADVDAFAEIGLKF